MGQVLSKVATAGCLVRSELQLVAEAEIPGMDDVCTHDGVLGVKGVCT